MSRLLIVCLVILLTACASLPPKPDYSPLARALISQDRSAIIAERGALTLSVKTDNIINLYLLMIDDKPYAIVANSKLLIENFHQYNLYQQQILKPILFWAYLHPIYRRETAKDIRILQREELLVAPSKIDLQRCEEPQPDCANLMRQRLQTLISKPQITQSLTAMAVNDPCINLNETNLAGEFANLCLANRKGDLKINLISHPQFIADQWLPVLEDKQVLEDRQD